MIIKRLFSKPVSQGIKELGQQMINNPMEWVQTRYDFVNTKHKDIEIWTANGIDFIKINGFDGLNYNEKYYLNKCIKQSLTNRLNSKLSILQNRNKNRIPPKESPNPLSDLKTPIKKQTPTLPETNPQKIQSNNA